MPPFRVRFWFDRRLIALALVVACGASGTIALLAQSGTNELPFTIQRVVVPPQWVARELDKATQGTLHALPLADFEARLQRLKKSLQTRDANARLTQSHYTAELIDRTLTNGKGRWTVTHAGQADAILPIASLNLALHGLSWEQGGEALLGEFEGASLGLLLKQSGSQTCTFDWSARGNVTSDGLSFVLRAPACPMTTFELLLPVDLWLAAPSSAVLVSGPFNTPMSDKRLWKIQATGQSQVDFQLRKIADPKGAARTIFSQVQTTHQLAPERITHEYDFNLDILHGSVRELVFEGDGELEPFDVSLKSGELKTWRWETLPPTKDPKTMQPARGGQLTVSFRQPVQGKLVGLKVRALAPVRQSGVWISPGLRIRESLSRGETLKIQIHPEVQIAKWDHGSFHANNITPGIDGGQVISLAEVGSTPATMVRPSFVRAASTVELSTREINHWRLDSNGALLSTAWTYSMQRGSLHQLTVRLPEKSLGYQVESLDMQPPEILRGWHTAGNYLTVELKQALVGGRKATLKLGLRAPFREIAGAGRVVPYPAVEPTDSTKREGTLAIAVASIFRSQLVAASVPLARTAAVAKSASLPREREDDEPSYLFTFRDQSVSASLRLIPQRVQVQMRGKQSFVLSDQGATARFRWEAEPLVGTPEFLDFRCTDRSLSSWQVKDIALATAEGGMRIRRWERLHVDEALPHLLHLGAGHGLNAAALEHALPGGAMWRFHLAEPLRKKSAFTLEAMVHAGVTLDDWRRASLSMPSAKPWEVIGGTMAAELLPRSIAPTAWTLPLLAPVQRANVSHDIAVESPHEPIIKAAAHGMRMVGDSRPSSLGGERAWAPVHSLHYHADHAAVGGAARLKVWTDPTQASIGANEACDEARLTISATAAGRLSQHVHFRLWHWRSGTCVVRFPTGTQIVGAKLQQQWLEHLEVREQADGITVVVPIDQNVPFVRCEIFSSAPMGSGFFPGVGAIAVPRIDWPVAPSRVRTRYFLADGLMPLQQEKMTRVGIPERVGDQSATHRWFGRVWSWGRSWFVSGARPGLVEAVGDQKQTLLTAEKQMRAAAKKDLLLRDALERLALQHLKDEVPLIVDRYAFASLGLTPTTALAPVLMNPQATPPFWEGLGLVHLASRSGALLTTARRLQAFGAGDGPAPEGLDEAMLEAIRHGRDSSTALVPAIFWSNLPPSTSLAPAPGSETLGFHADGAVHSGEMIEWELMPGEFAASSVFVVDASEGRLVGLLAAVLVGLVLWQIRRVCLPLACLRIYLLLLTTGLLLMIWLPITLVELLTLPALSVACGGFGWFLFTFDPYVGASKEGGAGPGSTMIKPAGAAALVAIFIMGSPWFSLAQPPAARAYTVLIVASARTTALVPAELIARLDELDQAADAPARNAVITRARYVGQVKDQSVVFEAVYDLISTKDHAELIVPLAGVQLHEGALLDKMPVFPTVHKNGYLIKLADKGRHTLRLPFSVRVTAIGGYVDMPFTIPKLAHSEITVRLPATVQALHSLHGWGEESFLTKPDLKEWHAQLGYESRVHLRWSGAKKTETAVGTEVNEIHYWDLRPGLVALSSSLTYSVGKGSLSQLAVALPDRQYVRNVEAFVISPMAAPSPISIKNWQVVGKGAQRRLIADLAQPVSSQILLNIEIVPQLSLNAKRLPLALPAPLQGKSVLGLVGYRIDVTELHPTAQNLSVQNILADDFVQAWKKQSNQPPLDLGGVSRAYRFERKAVQSGLELDIQPVVRQARMELSWKLEPHHADLVGKITLSSATDNIIVQNLVLPASCVLANVAGPDVAFWQVRDQLLQVWFRRPCKQTDIELTGWHRLDAVVKNAGAARAPGRFIVPVIYPLNVQLASSTLHVIPAGGLAVEPERLLRLQHSPPHEARRPDWRYAILDSSYEAEFRLTVKPMIPEAHLLTVLQATEDGMEIAWAIRLSTERGQLPPLKLHVKDWPGASLVLDAPGASMQAQKNPPPTQRMWTIQHGSGLPYDVVLTLRGMVGKDKHASITLPTVELDGVPFVSKWVQWKDVEIVDLAGKKLAAPPASAGGSPNAGGSPTIPLVLPTGVAPQHADWKQARLTSPAKANLPNSALLPKLHILHCDEQITAGERGQWIHESECWIAVQESANLRIRFPALLEHLNVFVDQELRMSRPLATNDYLLPLSASARPQRIRLSFGYAAGSLEQPRLDFPILGAGPAPARADRAARLVWVPTRMAGPGADWTSQPTHIERLLQQAAQHMRLAAATAQEFTSTADERSKFALEHQQTFYTRIRQVEHLLTVLKRADPTLISAWRARVNQLKQDNRKLAQEHDYDRQRDLAEKSRTTSHAPFFGANDLEAGIPWLAPAGAVRAALESAHAHAVAESRTRSQILVLATLALLVLTLLRHALAILHALVPEFVIMILVVSLLVFGWGLVGVVAVLAMVVMRLVWLIRVVRARFTAVPADERSTTSQPPAAPPT